MTKLLFIALMSMSFLANADIASKYINDKVCDQIIDKTLYKTCYSYKMKGALATSYTLDGKLVNKINIKKRDSWYSDKTIPRQYRSYPSDYSHTGYDKGHSANDADFDYSKQSLLLVYDISNATPQTHECNRYQWLRGERYERKMAVKYGTVHVLNIIKYSDKPERIGKHQIAVPSEYFKVIYNDSGFEECYAFMNVKEHDPKDVLKDHFISCNQLK